MFVGEGEGQGEGEGAIGEKEKVFTPGLGCSGLTTTLVRFLLHNNKDSFKRFLPLSFR